MQYQIFQLNNVRGQYYSIFTHKNVEKKSMLEKAEFAANAILESNGKFLSSTNDTMFLNLQMYFKFDIYALESSQQINKNCFEDFKYMYHFAKTKYAKFKSLMNKKKIKLKLNIMKKRYYFMSYLMINID